MVTEATLTCVGRLPTVVGMIIFRESRNPNSPEPRAHNMETSIVVKVVGANDRQSSQSATEFKKYLSTSNLGGRVNEADKDPSTQDLGATLVLIFGTSAITALANGIADWLRNRRQTSLEFQTPTGKVIATGITSADAVRIVETLTAQSRAE